MQFYLRYMFVCICTQIAHKMVTKNIVQTPQNLLYRVQSGLYIQSLVLAGDIIENSADLQGKKPTQLGDICCL